MTPDELKERIDLHDLAEKLGWERPGNSGNYRSPHRKDAQPSVNIYKGGTRFKDHTTGDGGSCIDMVMYHEDCEAARAIQILHELYGFERDKPQAPPREQSWPEVLAQRCKAQAERAIEYLTGRGIDEQLIRHCIKVGSIGFNTYTNPKKDKGTDGYGGPAVAFISRTINPAQVMAVDLRYLAPELNGGRKAGCQGEKTGVGWFSDKQRLLRAHTVVIVESPINALTVESVMPKGVAAFATRGLLIEHHDWRFLQRGRAYPPKVLICFDFDAPKEDGKRPGPETGWKLYDMLTAQGIATHMVNQVSWAVNDLNDMLQDEGPDDVRKALNNRFPWVLVGVPGEAQLSDEQRSQLGPNRVFLPAHDFAKYWLFRCKEDFTTFVKDTKKNEAGDEVPDFADLCGFRVAAIHRVNISSAQATLTGTPDTKGQTLFSVICQSGFHGNTLQRKVFDTEQIHNVDRWKNFGPIFVPSMFARMLQIIGRSAHVHETKAANFVGLVWKDGRLAVNEGPDTYFKAPEKQCPYSDLVFPNGPVSTAATVMRAFQHTFKRNAALLLLTWAVGAQLKAVLGFWPHMKMEAKKGAGKSTLIKRLESAIAIKVFAKDAITSAFRMLHSVSGSFHPVGWEELSTGDRNSLKNAMSTLQECYQFTKSPRGTGSDVLEYVKAAPVLIAGEETDINTVLGKVVCCDLNHGRGPLIPLDLPQFPMRPWLEFLTQQRPKDMRELFKQMHERCLHVSCARPDDTGAQRICENFAAVLTAWRLLCQFADYDPASGDFEGDLIMQMNTLIQTTEADREPFVWILQKIFLEIENGKFRYPIDWGTIDTEDGGACNTVNIRPAHIMHHLEHSLDMRDFYNSLPIKTARIFKKQLSEAGLILSEQESCMFDGRRYQNLCALSIEGLERYGLTPPPQRIRDQAQSTQSAQKNWMDK